MKKPIGFKPKFLNRLEKRRLRRLGLLPERKKNPSTVLGPIVIPPQVPPKTAVERHVEAYKKQKKEEE